MTTSIKSSFLSVDHYGLVVATSRTLGLAEFIDSKIPKLSNNKKISYGQLFECMLINFLAYTSEPLYLTPKFFETVDVKTLFGESFDRTLLNDDAFGRLLDALYDYGVSELFLEFTGEALKKLYDKTECIHLDSTSFHLHGEHYSDGVTALTMENITGKKMPAEPLRGYSRDAHPELLQIMLQIVSDENGLPVYMKPQDGNTNDNKGFQTPVELVGSLNKAIDFKYLVDDAALFTQENLKTMQNKNILFITRAPNKINDVKELISSVKQDELKPINEEYFCALRDFEYSDVKLKALVVHSTQSQNRAHKAIDAKVAKENEKIDGQIKQLSRKTFSCEPDALSAANELIKKFHYFTANEPQIISEPVYGRGKRAANAQPKSYKYRIELTVKQNLEVIDLEKNESSKFVIVTNDTDSEWTEEHLLKSYKEQQRVERGFRFLKEPKFFTDSIFLRKCERIESLLMIMVTSLFIYSATEFLLRKKLKAQNKTLPNQLNKEISNPTLRWVFSNFRNVGKFVKTGSDDSFVSLTDFQIRTLRILSDEWESMYHKFLE